MPVWGVWIERTFYFGADRCSQKGKNLAHQPAITVHFESGDDVVIVEGVAALVSSASVLAAVDEAYNSKYGMRVVGIPGNTGIYSVSPRTVFAWREKDFTVSATRWMFRKYSPFPRA